MSDIVLLGLRDDHDRVRPVVDALHANQLDFWWEREGPGSLAAGDRVAAARCVVLFLTRASVADAGFMAMATQAVVDRKAIGARLDRMAVPARLSGMTVVHLTGFKGSKDDLFLIDLKEAADSKAKGIDPPAPRGPISRLTKRAWALGAAGFALLALAIGLVADVFGASSGLVDLWTRFDGKQKAAYEQATSCEALRAFARGREGHYADRARARFENPKWIDGTERVELRTTGYVMRNDMAVAGDRAGAEAAAREAMGVEAGKVCRARAAPGGAVVESRFEPDNWTCAEQAGGVACGLLAQVVCVIDQPTKVEDCSEG